MRTLCTLVCFLAAPFGLSFSGCAHPCERDPGLCPAPLRMTPPPPTTTPPPPRDEVRITSSAWLLQRGLAQDLDITVFASSALPAPLQFYLCSATGACAPGCQAEVKLTAERKDASVLTYRVSGDAIRTLPLGARKLCGASGDAVYDGPVLQVINRRLAARLSEPSDLSTLVGVSLRAVSFDFVAGAEGQAGAPQTSYGVFLTQDGGKRAVMNAEHPATSLAMLENQQAEFKNLSMRITAVGTKAFVFAQEPILLIPYVLSPYKVRTWSPGSPLSDSQGQLSLDSIRATAGDVLANRFLLARDEGARTSLQAYSTTLPGNGKALRLLWDAVGPAGDVELAAAQLKRSDPRKQSDVIAVAKNKSLSEAGDVRVFLNEDTKPDAAYSGGLLAALRGALASRPLAALTSADLDGDGLAEVIVASTDLSGGQVHILFNQGDGTFRVAGGAIKDPEMHGDIEAELVNLRTSLVPLDAKVNPYADPPEVVVLGAQAVQRLVIQKVN